MINSRRKFFRIFFSAAVALAAVSAFSGCFVLLPFIEPYQEPARPEYAYSDSAGIHAARPAPSSDGVTQAWINYYVEQLHDKKPAKRSSGATYLGMMGAKASSAEPELIRALSDDSKFVRRAAARSLGKIGLKSDSTVAALERSTHDKDPYVARTAQLALDKLNTGAGDSVAQNSSSTVLTNNWSKKTQ